MPLKEVKSDLETYQASLLLKCEKEEFPCKVHWLTISRQVK